MIKSFHCKEEYIVTTSLRGLRGLSLFITDFYIYFLIIVSKTRVSHKMIKFDQLISRKFFDDELCEKNSEAQNNFMPQLAVFSMRTGFMLLLLSTNLPDFDARYKPLVW